MAALLLLLLSVGALFSPSNAQEAYDGLPETFKKGVDLALEKLSSHAGILHHFLFLRTISKSNIEPGFDVTYIYHNFYLKATKCPKGTVDSTACQFRNDRPLIDCAVCYKTYRGAIEQEPKPYVHCVHRPSLTEEMKTARVDHCNTMGYSSGSPTLLASTATVVFSVAQEAYDGLPETFKKGVDLALEKLSSHAGIQHHFLFLRTISKSNIEPGFDVTYIYHNFYLKATKCPKGTVDSTACQFRNDRPLIDCAVCYKTYRGAIEQEPKPYVHCVHRPSLTEEMKTARVDHCHTMGSSSDFPTSLASTATE